MMQSIKDSDVENESKNLTRFIAKLYRIVNSDEPTVCWVPNGKSFLILDPEKFSKTVLPKYFKHSKFTSFVRQLNFYGFHKIRICPTTLITNDSANKHNVGDRKLTESEDMVHFHHSCFQANQPKLLIEIKRATRQTSQTMAESQYPKQREEIESMQKQLREMKNNMDCMKENFQVELAEVRADLELDYLHRIKSIEVCYKDLVMMILRAKESSEVRLPIREQAREISRPEASEVYESVSHRYPSNSLSLDPNYTSRDFLVEHKLNLLSRRDNHIRRNLIEEKFEKENRSTINSLVDESLRCLLSKRRRIVS